MSDSSQRSLQSVPRISSGSIAIVSALIALVAVAAFWPAHSATWVNWDDDLNLTNNLEWRGLSGKHLNWMFATGHAGVYQPLGWMAFAVQHALFDGDDGRISFGEYHAVSLALHALNAVLFFLICLKLFEPRPEDLDRWAVPQVRWQTPVFAGIAALMFAVHPLRAECVAWLSCQPYLWATLFALAAVWVYLHRRQYTGVGGLSLILLVTVLFAMSQLCKAVAIALPLALLVLDVLPLRRVERQSDGGIRWGSALVLVAEKLPMLAIAAYVAWKGHEANAVFYPATPPQWTQRALTSVCAAAFYVWKTFFPIGLSPQYELYGTWSLGDPRMIASIATFVIITVASLVLAIRRRPTLLVIWVSYLLLIGPVLGWVWHGDHLAADRYSYLACLPFAVLMGSVLVALDRRRPGWSAFSPAPFVMAAVVLFALSWRQADVWGDSISLWRHALAVDDQSSTARLNLGLALASPDVHPGPTPPTAAELTEARALFERLLEKQPAHFNAWKGLGIAFAGLNMVEESVRAQENALRIRPNDPEAIYSYATALSGAGRFEEARSMFQRAVELDPRDYKALTNLGMTLDRLNHLPDAIDRLKEAVAVNPSHARAWFQLGNVYVRINKMDEAKEAYERALQLEPGSVEVRIAQADMLDKSGHRKEAKELLLKTVESFPLAPEPYLAVSRLLLKEGHFREARLALKSGYKRLKDQGRVNAELTSELAWQIAINPNISPIDRKAALELAKQGLGISGGNTFLSLKALGAALAVNGDFESAIKVADTAIDAARADHQLAIQQLFEAYRGVFVKREPIRSAESQPTTQPATQPAANLPVGPVPQLTEPLPAGHPTAAKP